jgi:hypothetical protein
MRIYIVISRFSRLADLYADDSNSQAVKNFNKWAKKTDRQAAWGKALKLGNMPDLNKYPDQSFVEKKFAENYFSFFLRPRIKTQEESYKKVVDLEISSSVFYFEHIRPGWVSVKGHKKNNSLVLEHDSRISNKIKKIFLIKNKRQRFAAYKAELLKTEMKKIDIAFEAAKKLVKLENLEFQMLRVEDTEHLRKDPVLHNNLSRPNGSLTRRSEEDVLNFTRDLFSNTKLKGCIDKNIRDCYPKFASIMFKEVPEGIVVDFPFRGERSQIFGNVPYKVFLEKIKNRAFYLPGDGLSFWPTFINSQESYLLSPDSIDEVDGFTGDKIETRVLDVTRNVVPLHDLSNLFEHVFESLIQNPNHITWPQHMLMEVMIYGELKYGRDFDLDF